MALGNIEAFQALLESHILQFYSSCLAFYEKVIRINYCVDCNVSSGSDALVHWALAERTC